MHVHAMAETEPWNRFYRGVFKGILHNEKILLYSLSFMTIGLAAGLLIVHNMMIARLSNEQIRRSNHIELAPFD